MILFAFTFLCVLCAAGFVGMVGIRSGIIKSAAPKVRDVALEVGLLDPKACVVDYANRLDCRAEAVGTPVQIVLGRMREMEEELAREKDLRAAAEDKAKTATQALKRLADLQAQQAEPAAQPFVMLPGDTVQPLSRRMTLVYRQPLGADKVLLASDLWEGDREMEFYKPYRATLDEPGQPATEVELVVSPAPDWNQGDRSIRLELTPQQGAVVNGFSAPE